jgi:S1-C subfamily serine protease
MSTRVLLLLAALLIAGAVEAREPAGANRAWEHSIVTVDVTRKDYDYQQPWSRRAQSATKSGLVVGPKEVLTTALDLDDRTLVRLQKNGRGRWWDAVVLWVDYPANLALLSVGDAAFWQGLKPATLAGSISRDTPIQVMRWRAGGLEVRKAEFNRFAVNVPNFGDASHVLLELNAEMDGVGWGEPVVQGKKVIGLVSGQAGNLFQVLPSLYLSSMLDARRRGETRGLGYFDFTWQPAENPETLRYLRLEGEPRGVVVISVPKRGDTASVLKPKDIILQIDGFDVDTQGDYLDPDYGHLMLENLATRRKWAGDPVKLKIWREGRPMEVTCVLPRIEAASKLVPEAPYDKPPEYLIVGGLVFQPLTKNLLRGWGQDWERRAPFRLAYFRGEEATPERPSVVVLSQVLPDIYTLGYQDARNLVLERVNGRKISRLDDILVALREPRNGFHEFEFLKGESLQRIVLDAATLNAATQRVLERYGIEADRVVHPPRS